MVMTSSLRSWRARSVLYSPCQWLESIWDQHLRDRLVGLPALKSGSISRPMRMDVCSAGRILATFPRLRNPRRVGRPRRVEATSFKGKNRRDEGRDRSAQRMRTNATCLFVLQSGCLCQDSYSPRRRECRGTPSRP